MLLIGGFNLGDILYQLLAFFSLIAIPTVIIFIFFIVKKRNNRLERIEDKLNQLLLKDKEK
jgi:hypothetical protein